MENRRALEKFSLCTKLPWHPSEVRVSFPKTEWVQKSQAYCLHLFFSFGVEVGELPTQMTKEANSILRQILRGSPIISAKREIADSSFYLSVIGEITASMLMHVLSFFSAILQTVHENQDFISALPKQINKNSRGRQKKETPTKKQTDRQTSTRSYFQFNYHIFIKNLSGEINRNSCFQTKPYLMVLWKQKRSS